MFVLVLPLDIRSACLKKEINLIYFHFFVNDSVATSRGCTWAEQRMQKQHKGGGQDENVRPMARKHT